jgi:dipeptidyl aminopeptidase/acylaminoacyl peptidase
MAAVETTWAQRDLAPEAVREETTGRLNLGSTNASVRIISYRVHGQKNYGAIIIPDGVGAKAPVILDLKGVSWDYFPLHLNSIIAPKILGEAQNKFVYFVPSFRGEVLDFDNRQYVSEGDRTDSWDGAADDALAFLNAALTITPQADASRICAFGKSRGGSLALLAGIRDPKIKFVIDWAGPVDWFGLMGTDGWTQKEIVRDALLFKAAPQEEGGQFIERFLAKSISGNQSLREARIKMLASSPLYFAERLPLKIQIHYGEEDEMVPLVNGRKLLQRIKKRNSTFAEAYFYPSSGHDLDLEKAYRRSKIFLLRHLLKT